MKSLLHFNSLLNESHVSDSDSQSIIGRSQSLLILPSSYSFDQVRGTLPVPLSYCKSCAMDSARLQV